MRVGLISLIERAGDDPETPLAVLALAGHTLAERQLELLIGLGCERVICLSGSVGRDLIALQHRAEAHGARFNLIAGPRQMSGLVNSADELIVVADGLLPATAEAKATLASGTGVVVLPVEPGIAAGFERIDLNHAWAGLLGMPGALVERINQLPPDCDTISALLRIALQGRVPERSLPEAVLAERRWALITSREMLAQLEPDWFRRHIAPPSLWAPGRAAARLGMRKWGGTLLAKGWKPSFLAAAGIALAGLGVVSAWFEHAVAGIILCGLGWISGQAGAALAMLARAGSDREEGGRRSLALAAILIDLAFVAVLALALHGTRAERLFPPLVLLGALRIASAYIPAKWAEIAQDRAALALLLAIAAAAGVLLPAIQLLVLLLIAALLGFSRESGQITRA